MAKNSTNDDDTTPEGVKRDERNINKKNAEGSDDGAKNLESLVRDYNPDGTPKN